MSHRNKLKFVNYGFILKHTYLMNMFSNLANLVTKSNQDSPDMLTKPSQDPPNLESQPAFTSQNQENPSNLAYVDKNEIFTAIITKKVDEDYRRPSIYLRNRKGGRAGIIYEIEEKEKADLPAVKPRLFMTQKTDKREDLLVERHVSDKFSCHCSVCMNSAGRSGFDVSLKINPRSFDASEQSTVGSDLDKDFVFVIKKLYPPKHVQRSLRLFVPDTAAFGGGEIKYIVMTGKDKTLKFIKQRDKLTLHELRKFFHERRRRKDDLPYSGPEESEQVSMNRGTSTFSEQQQSANDESQTMSRVVEGTIKDSDNINTREVTLVKYRDDSTHILTEMEFNHYLLKRKVDKIWKEVQYIQTFARSKRGLGSSVQAFFAYNIDKKDPLFDRAKLEIQYLNGDLPQASEDYIPLGEEEKFEEDLKNASPKRYCQYLLFKIAHFLEIVSSVRVSKMIGDFVKDEFGFYWLINLSKVQYKILSGNGREENQAKNVDAFVKEENSRLTNELEAHYRNIGRREAVKLLNDIMQQHYESVKKKVNVKFMVENYYEDNISDEVFAKIHPDAPFKLSDLLRNKLKYEEIRDFVIRNCGKLQGDQYFRDGSTVSKAVKHSHESEVLRYKINQNEDSVMRSSSIERGSSPYRNSISKNKLARSSSVDRGLRRSVSSYRDSVEALDASRQSETGGGNAHINSFFKAVKYFKGRKNQREDNPNDYIGDREEEDPAVSMYYYQRQQSMKDMQRDSYQRKGSTLETNAASSGTSYVLSNLSKNAFSGISIQQESRNLDGFRTNSLPMLPQRRNISNFFENMPNQQSKMTNVGPLLQGASQTDR